MIPLVLSSFSNPHVDSKAWGCLPQVLHWDPITDCCKGHLPDLHDNGISLAHVSLRWPQTTISLVATDAKALSGLVSWLEVMLANVAAQVSHLIINVSGSAQDFWQGTWGRREGMQDCLPNILHMPKTLSQVHMFDMRIACSHA